MKRISIILSLLVLLSVSAIAQVKIGYYSQQEALKSMPEYATVQKQINDLKVQYETEMKRSETEFNAKYEEFLEVFSSYANSIRQKRQSELKEMMERNIAFRNEAVRHLKQAEEDAMTPLKDKLDITIRRIATKYGYAIILNTDSNACPYIDPAIGDNIKDLISSALQ